MNQNKPCQNQNHSKTQEGVCQNNSAVRPSCSTAQRMNKKVKGKGTEPFAPKEGFHNSFF